MDTLYRRLTSCWTHYAIQSSSWGCTWLRVTTKYALIRIQYNFRLSKPITAPLRSLLSRLDTPTLWVFPCILWMRCSLTTLTTSWSFISRKFLHSKTQNENLESLRKVCERLRYKEYRGKLKTFLFKVKEVTYLDFRLKSNQQLFRISKIQAV